MKTELKEKAKQDPQLGYPIVMKSTKEGLLVVLFSNRSTGTVIHQYDTCHKVGDNRSDWYFADGSYWTILDGDVILSNE